MADSILQSSKTLSLLSNGQTRISLDVPVIIDSFAHAKEKGPSLAERSL